MLDLIDRIEAATGADKELDHAIADAVLGPIKPPLVRGFCASYTGSIDAAMGLVPSWCYPHMRFDFYDGWICEMHNSIGVPFKHTGKSQADRPYGFTLALCAAALKARESEG